MKPYGMNRIEAGDTDVVGCSSNGRSTRTYALGKRSYKSLRNGKKAAARRIHKRRARAEGRLAARESA
jgi:hypothetical protein